VQRIAIETCLHGAFKGGGVQARLDDDALHFEKL